MPQKGLKMTKSEIGNMIEFALVTKTAVEQQPHAHVAWCQEMVTKAKRHHTLCEKACNTGDEAVDQSIERLEYGIKTLAATNPAVKAVKFGHDPRGCTVQLVLKSGLSNGWERDAWCVPI